MLSFRVQIFRLRCAIDRWRFGPDAETLDSPPIVKLAHRIIDDAYLQGAATVLFTRTADWVEVRYAIQGALHEQMSLPVSTFASLNSRYAAMRGSDGLIDYARFHSMIFRQFKVQARLRVQLEESEELRAREFSLALLRENN